ncbi:MAG: FAD-dependent oxidoreductase [Candidatus Micrarchaeota archaeon]
MANVNIAELRKVRDYKITSIREDVHNIIILTLSSVTSDRLPNSLPGQFLNLHTADLENKPIFRPYSIASSPGVTDLELCIKILPDGKFSAPLSKKKVGDTIGVSGPYGFFTYENQTNAVFMTAGTGIAPIMAMLRTIVEKNVQGNFILFYSNKTKDSIIYFDELNQMMVKNPSIKIIFTLTQETDGPWAGEKGRICDPMVKKYLNKAEDFDYYFCGPLEFIKTMKTCVVSLGAKPEKIKAEGWG